MSTKPTLVDTGWVETLQGNHHRMTKDGYLLVFKNKQGFEKWSFMIMFNGTVYHATASNNALAEFSHPDSAKLEAEAMMTEKVGEYNREKQSQYR